MTMTQSYVKYPTDVTDFPINWSLWLASKSNDTIKTVTWVVPTGLTKTDSTLLSSVATIWLSGGVAGTTYDVVCRITTNGGREQDFVFLVEVISD